MATQHPMAIPNRNGLSHPLRHEVSHESVRSHTQAGPADVRPAETQSSVHHAPQASSSDHHPPLAQRIASTLRRSSSAALLLQERQPEETAIRPSQPWITGPSRCSSSPSSSIDSQPSTATSRPSNVSGRASLSHSAGSHEWTPAANSENSYHDPNRRRQDSRSANVYTDSGHGSADSDAFESEEVNLTALRRIVEKMEQREAQFIKRNGRKLHRYPASAVPYPRSYDRTVVDHDVWCMMWSQQLSGKVAWHLFNTPPQRFGSWMRQVIHDIASHFFLNATASLGTGTWILDAAKSWKDAHFVGLDVVPLHPNLEEIDPILAWRVTWVQANFLERLPFDDGEFDFVHVRRVARGIPEDKWDHVLEEISRIMKPGGAVELTEEDISFPGIRQQTPVKSDDAPTSNTPDQQPSTMGSPLARPRAPTPSSMTSYEQNIPLSAIPSIPQSTSSKSAAGSKMSPNDLSHNVPDEPPINPHDHSLLEFIYNEMHAAKFINLAPLSLLSNMLPLYFQGVRTHPPLVVMFPPPPHESCNLGTVPDPAPPPLTTSYAIPSQDKVSPSEGGSEPADDLMSSETIAVRLERLDLTRINPSADGKTPFVSVPQLVSGAAKYLSADMARYTAYAPRSLFQPNKFQQKGPAPPLPKGAKGGDSQNGGDAKETWGEERLPITAVKCDTRTLNLHLSVRVQEVLACAEAMWDFVEAYQERAGVDLTWGKASSMTSSSTGSDASNMAPRRPVQKTTRNPKWKQLLGLQRSHFDALLMRFKFDMEDCLGFDAVLEDRLGWNPVSLSRSEERMEFDAMCDAWADHQEVLARSRTSSGKDSVPRLSTPPLTRSSLSMEPHTFRTSEGQDTLRGPKSGAYPALQKVRESGDVRYSQGESFTSRPRRQQPIPPHERLSRTIRSFVAFKP
ncbi:uncharacterized protein B0H18DRAFT_1114020 [Fomitopsis serialis]|uniref:uncharacterized protein n=1 Tax=Fomitopsis serialis TaxID=139415 RepID=UPI0020072FAE|nr:uncharacterized protein B0H18DRAFT_1114020 [Neoantrodia serialis]KAH9936658.1 hypothetical protein B0H18DRAFT_1114020 [Neoantrodia serialis]